MRQGCGKLRWNKGWTLHRIGSSLIAPAQRMCCIERLNPPPIAAAVLEMQRRPAFPTSLLSTGEATGRRSSGLAALAVVPARVLADR